MRARTTRFLGATAIAAGACLLLTGTASAVPAANGVPEVLAAAGSDTIFNVTAPIFANANSGTWNTDPDNYVNVPPVLTGTTTFTVPADPFNAAVTYNATTNVPPDGSSAGKAALKASADAGNGLIDLARSSSPRATSDPSTFEYYGFAKDGVTWASSATGSGAGLSLTITQLRSIYNGTITNWNQVGGGNAAIKLYLPQVGSGTLSFFTGTVLGFDPATISGLTINRFQENDATSIPAANQATAIVPFSVAQWVAQGNSVSPNKRAGFTVNKLTGAGSDGAPVTGSAGAYVPAFADTFLGARTVFYVLDNRTVSYGQAKRAVGFDPTDHAATASPLCGGKLAATLTQYGFKPLAANANGITCVKS
jgi:phosphate transport system substrate-binding protein